MEDNKQNSRKGHFGSKKRRGLSTIVGGLIFVILMVGTFSIMGEALQSQTNLMQVSREISDINLKRQQEDWTITASTDPSLVLDVTINNKGQNAVEIFTMFITNSTDIASNFPTKKYEIPSSTSFITPASSSNILSSTPMTMTLNNNYEIKVISSHGIIKTVQLVCGVTYCGPSGYAALAADMYMDPPFGIPTKNVTAVMAVTNTGHTTLTDVKPDFELPDTSWIEYPPTSSMTGPVLDSTSPVSLEPQQTVLFKWDLVVHGKIGDTWNFTNAATGLDPRLDIVSSTNSTDQITLIDPIDCGDDCGISDEAYIYLDDLVIKPGIFLTIPSPFGTAGSAQSAGTDIGIWGVNVANPTNSTIKINKVTITAYAPGANSNILIFDNGGDYENLSPPGPGVQGDWLYSGENVMIWQNIDNPVTLGPFSTETFAAKVKPHHNSLNLESVLIQASVFSDWGSYGKTGYQTTMFSDGGTDNSVIANVYLSDVVDSRETADIRLYEQSIPAGTVKTFRAVLADMDHDESTKIRESAQLIVDVPPDWTNIILDLGASSNIQTSPPPQIWNHGEGTTQIIANTTVALGEAEPLPQAATLVFTAKAPIEDHDRMSIMYILANGRNENDSTIGPLAEVVLHTLPAP